MSEIDISKVRGGINTVVIKLIDMNESISFKDGSKFYLSTKFEPQDHVPVWGEVVGLPSKLYFNKKDIPNSMEWETDMELHVGDTVYMEYLAVLRALSTEFNPADAYPQPQWFKQDGVYYIIIRYQDIYFRVVDNEIFPINGYCVAKPINVRQKEYKGIILPEPEKKSRKWAEITYVGKSCKDFVDKKDRDSGDVKAGDVVLFNRWSNQKVENKLHQTLFKDDGDYFVIQRKWMKVNAGNEARELVESGVLN